MKPEPSQLFNKKPRNTTVYSTHAANRLSSDLLEIEKKVTSLNHRHSLMVSKKNFLETVENDQETTEKKFKQHLEAQRKNLISHKPRRQQLYYIFHLILNQR